MLRPYLKSVVKNSFSLLRVLCVLSGEFKAASLLRRISLKSLAAVLFCALSVCAAEDPVVQISFEGAADVRLEGAAAREQLLVVGRTRGGAELDLTRAVEFGSEPNGVVRVDGGGILRPVGDGEASVTAKGPDGLTATLRVAVKGFGADRAINFANQVVPIFTKLGCNGGGCHGKSGGQNGFKLSLLGFEPADDYEYLVKETRGRRIFPASPERSLLLLKGTALLPHGGGKRLEPDSADYQLLVRWIAQGMPFGSTNDPTVARIEVLPPERTMKLGAEQQIKVVAHYSDGSREDVTREALFEPNDKDLAKAGETGLVRTYERPGDVAVMVRYQSHAAVFRAALPQGAPLKELPPANNFVDDLVFAKLKKMGMPPSGLASDAAFIRRATLDIAGRLPTVEESRAFVASGDAQKRNALVDRLVGSSEYAEFFANKWSALLRNKRANDTHTRGTYAFHAWIRDSLLENKPYDRFVREILASSGDIAQNPPVAWYRQARTTTTQMEDTAQLFLGQRLQCAQCHHHPYEKWSQQDYFQFSAFFSQVGRRAGSQPGEEAIFHRRGMPAAKNPKTQKTVQPVGLGAVPATFQPDEDPRLALAEWLSKPENPFFARALVNRYWKHFFNRGLVDPEDDMRATNPASNPELLEALAKRFVESGYDLKALVRAICQSRTYQLSSEPADGNRLDRQNFSRYFPRRLPAEVLLDAINQVTGVETAFEGLPRGSHAVQLPDNSFNQSSYFLSVFGRPEMSSSCECERSSDASLAQSLHLLNSKDIQTKLTSNQGRPALMAGDGTRPEAEKVRELYLMAFSREATAEEIARASAHIDGKVGGASAEKRGPAKREAWEDIVWALLSTKEFLFNH